MFDNCFHKIFLKQAVELNNYIDEFDQENILGLKVQKGIFSEFYYKSDHHKKIIRYFPTEYEFEKYHSDKDDNEILFRIHKRSSVILWIFRII